MTWIARCWCMPARVPRRSIGYCMTKSGILLTTGLPRRDFARGRRLRAKSRKFSFRLSDMLFLIHIFLHFGFWHYRYCFFFYQLSKKNINCIILASDLILIQSDSVQSPGKLPNRLCNNKKRLILLHGGYPIIAWFFYSEDGFSNYYTVSAHVIKDIEYWI